MNYSLQEIQGIIKKGLNKLEIDKTIESLERNDYDE